MNSEIMIFFSIYRQIFGICSCCGEIFRLSDAKISAKKKFKTDWYEEIQKKLELLDKKEVKLDEQKKEIQEKAREKGYKKAMMYITKIDTIFRPRKLDPDDAKVLFHPVDYSVFDGMREDDIKKVVFFR